MTTTQESRNLEKGGTGVWFWRSTSSMVERTPSNKSEFQKEVSLMKQNVKLVLWRSYLKLTITLCGISAAGDLQNLWHVRDQWRWKTYGTKTSEIQKHQIVPTILITVDITSASRWRYAKQTCGKRCLQPFRATSTWWWSLTTCRKLPEPSRFATKKVIAGFFSNNLVHFVMLINCIWWIYNKISSKLVHPFKSYQHFLKNRLTQRPPPLPP